MSLPPQWQKWAIPLMQYGVRFLELGHMGQSERQKYRDGDEEYRASKREPLTSAPTLGERRHRSLACRLIAVLGPTYSPARKYLQARPISQHATALPIEAT